jgi:hypothetical protein
MSPSDDSFVEVEYRIVRTNGAPAPLIIRIGKPYEISQDEWACAVSMMGLHPRLADIHAQDALQALGLAMALIRSLLEHFVKSGGRLLFKTEDEDVPISATFGDPVGTSEESA